MLYIVDMKKPDWETGQVFLFENQKIDLWLTAEMSELGTLARGLPGPPFASWLAGWGPDFGQGIDQTGTGTLGA